MKERGNSEIVTALEALGFLAKKKPDIFNAIRKMRQAKGLSDNGPIEPGGEADYHAISRFSTMGAWIEVKYGHNSFDFAELSVKQRDFLSENARSAWFWLGLGDRIGSKTSPRHIWLIPWTEWLTIEAHFVEHGLNSIPLLQPHALKHRELKLSAVDQLSNYEFVWDGCVWAPVPWHPFLRLEQSLQAVVEQEIGGRVYAAA